MWYRITIAIALKVRNTWRAPKRYADHRLRLSGELSLPHPDLRIRPGVIAVLGIAARSIAALLRGGMKIKSTRFQNVRFLSQPPEFRISGTGAPELRAKHRRSGGVDPDLRVSIRRTSEAKE